LEGVGIPPLYKPSEIELTRNTYFKLRAEKDWFLYLNSDLNQIERLFGIRIHILSTPSMLDDEEDYFRVHFK